MASPHVESWYSQIEAEEISVDVDGIPATGVREIMSSNLTFNLADLFGNACVLSLHSTYGQLQRCG